MVLVVGEAAAEAGLGAAVGGVGDEAGGGIAVGGEELGEGRMRPSSGPLMPAESSWGQRPVIMLACEGSVQGAVDAPART